MAGQCVDHWLDVWPEPCCLSCIHFCPLFVMMVFLIISLPFPQTYLYATKSSCAKMPLLHSASTPHDNFSLETAIILSRRRSCKHSGSCDLPSTGRSLLSGQMLSSSRGRSTGSPHPRALAPHPERWIQWVAAAVQWVALDPVCCILLATLPFQKSLLICQLLSAFCTPHHPQKHTINCR